MEFAQLEALVIIAQERSFSRAAERLARTQPAISIAIKKLEEEIGVLLLDRARKNIALTDAGEVLFEYAQKIINLRSEAIGSIKELRQLHHGKVTVGANESTSLYFLPNIILAYRQQHPMIKVEVYRTFSEQLSRMVKEHRLDFAILAYDPQDSQLASFPVLHDELVLVMNSTHRLAKKSKITVHELGEETFLAHNVKSPARDKVVQFFRDHHVPLNISIELATIETIKRFAEMNMGLAIVPRMCVEEELQTGKLVTVPIQGLKIRRTLRVAYLHDRVLSHAAAAFLQLVKEYSQHARLSAPSNE
ncbi:MAG: LysR family transcriptional regulator [Acidobacteria bacterium]|nr:LysR family transcriptional regulator [Acidobacteriota bacterium]